MISTRDLSALPDVPALKRLMQSLATLDALLCRWGNSRPHRFNHNGPGGGQVGTKETGSSDDLTAHFTPAGCVLKGYDHETAMSPWMHDPPRPWPGVLDAVPSAFASSLADPTLGFGRATFCVWRRPADDGWQCGPVEFPPGDDPDGSAHLLSILDGRPETYLAWAHFYFAAQSLTLDMVRHVYEHRDLTDEFVAPFSAIFSHELVGGDPFTLADLAADLAAIGYPARR